MGRGWLMAAGLTLGAHGMRAPSPMPDGQSIDPWPIVAAVVVVIVVTTGGVVAWRRRSINAWNARLVITTAGAAGVASALAGRLPDVGSVPSFAVSTILVAVTLVLAVVAVIRLSVPRRGPAAARTRR